MNGEYNTVTSTDGTRIAYDVQGEGPAVILIDGALCTRSFGSKPELAQRLAAECTVYNYDRRGRGDSSDTKPYAVAREIEDIAALIDAAGGAASLYGHSSGAALAFEAAIALGAKVEKLAMYEAPYNDAEEARQGWKAYTERLTECLANGGSGGDAAALFMALVGMPEGQIAGMRQAPIWPYFEAVGPTLAYDAAVLGNDSAVPTTRAAGTRMPALVMSGSASFPFMEGTARALSGAMPHGHLRILEGETHEVHPEALAPVLAAFFRA